MKVLYKDSEYHCAVELALYLIGGKWKALILWLLGSKTHRFGEIKKAFPLITQKMLTKQLRELEEEGLITRHVYAQVPPKVEYSITDIGTELIPILKELSNWGIKHASERGAKVFVGE